MKRGIIIKAKVILISLIFSNLGCKERKEGNEINTTERSKNHFFDFRIGEVPKIEIAALPEERAKGLMFRDSMALNEGMFFIFTEGTSQRFWMKIHAYHLILVIYHHQEFYLKYTKPSHMTFRCSITIQ